MSSETILLVGDSLTQQGYLSNWVSRLSHHYIRRADVVPRGYSGYNSRWVLDYLHNPETRPLLLPPFARQPLFATLLLGANDLALTAQHVPVEEYQSNMKQIISILCREVQPQGALFVFTPPPVDQEAWMVTKNLTKADRLFSETRRYRAALLDVVQHQLTAAETHGVEVIVVDLHNAILAHGDLDVLTRPEEAIVYDAKAPWTRLLYDGLHFNDAGGELMETLLLDAIRKAPKAAVMMAEKIPMPLPEWEAVAALYAAKEGKK